jgi:hypothetical protein
MKTKNALEGRFGASGSFLFLALSFFVFVSALPFFSILQKYRRRRKQM